jgi:hypothetical protein
MSRLPNPRLVFKDSTIPIREKAAVNPHLTGFEKSGRLTGRPLRFAVCYGLNSPPCIGRETMTLAGYTPIFSAGFMHGTPSCRAAGRRHG